MGGIAREMNLSETTFVFPSTNPTAHYRNRIFTPGGEIPFAGHPAIGTAFVAAMEGLVPHPDGSSVVYQELEIGVLPLELICEAGQVKKVIMTQGEPSVGAEVKNVEPLAAALGVRAKDLGPKGLAPQIAATGIQSLQVPFRSLDVVKGLDPDLRDLGKVLSKFGEKVVCYAFALGGETPGAAVHARSFVPDLGIEDPATGSAAGACGAYLASRGRLPAPTFVIEQGIEIHHASRIEVSVETEGGKPRVVPVAGITVGLRVASPFLLYRRVQDRLEARRWWSVFRWFVAVGFVVLIAILAYHLLLLASGSEPANVAVFSEQLVMALGASLLIVRAGLRIRPRETAEMWPIWSAAVLFAIAFVVVLPYAIPAFELVYVVSGIAGWSLGGVAVISDF